MTDRRLAGIRWLAILPCALLATAIVQIGSEGVFRYALVVSVGLESWTGGVAKTLAAVLMGAIFVSVAWCVAPRAKFLVSALALAAVILWGGLLMLDSLKQDSPGWLLAMGLCGITGGTLMFELARRLRASRAD